MSLFCISYYHLLLMQNRHGVLLIYFCVCSYFFCGHTHVWRLEINFFKLLSTLCFETWSLSGLKLATQAMVAGQACLGILLSSLTSSEANKTVLWCPAFPCVFWESSSGSHNCRQLPLRGRCSKSVVVTARRYLVQT